MAGFWHLTFYSLLLACISRKVTGATAQNFGQMRDHLTEIKLCRQRYPALRYWTRRGIKIPMGFLMLLALGGWSAPGTPQAANAIEEINAEFHFLGAEDTLLLHEEEGKLSGQIDVYQNGDESDDVLSYDLRLGLRKNDRVEFKTAQVHRKYFRFSGAVQRGSGHAEKDADYIRLVGDLEIITVRGDSGEESVERKQVVLKSMSASEISDE